MFVQVAIYNHSDIYAHFREHIIYGVSHYVFTRTETDFPSTIIYGLGEHFGVQLYNA